MRNGIATLELANQPCACGSKSYGFVSQSDKVFVLECRGCTATYEIDRPSTWTDAAVVDYKLRKL